MSSIYKLFLHAHTSTANFLFLSVAVVITGSAEIYSAISTAISFAPPIWPESTGITYLPVSSKTITAASLSFDIMHGATALTAIPKAEINIMALLWLKIPDTNDFISLSSSFIFSLPYENQYPYGENCGTSMQIVGGKCF